MPTVSKKTFETELQFMPLAPTQRRGMSDARVAALINMIVLEASKHENVKELKSYARNLSKHGGAGTILTFNGWTDDERLDELMQCRSYIGQATPLQTATEANVVYVAYWLANNKIGSFQQLVQGNFLSRFACDAIIEVAARVMAHSNERSERAVHEANKSSVMKNEEAGADAPLVVADKLELSVAEWERHDALMKAFDVMQAEGKVEPLSAEEARKQFRERFSALNL